MADTSTFSTSEYFFKIEKLHGLQRINTTRIKLHRVFSLITVAYLGFLSPRTADGRITNNCASIDDSITVHYT